MPGAQNMSIHWECELKVKSIGRSAHGPFAVIKARPAVSLTFTRTSSAKNERDYITRTTESRESKEKEIALPRFTEW
jgi:hypothetical protein